jgi:hypothetical protein
MKATPVFGPLRKALKGCEVQSDEDVTAAQWCQQQPGEFSAEEIK